MLHTGEPLTISEEGQEDIPEAGTNRRGDKRIYPRLMPARVGFALAAGSGWTVAGGIPTGVGGGFSGRAARGAAVRVPQPRPPRLPKGCPAGRASLPGRQSLRCAHIEAPTQTKHRSNRSEKGSSCSEYGEYGSNCSEYGCQITANMGQIATNMGQTAANMGRLAGRVLPGEWRGGTS
eukprot:1195665-Prorocentrum_minimum.AAC.6